LKRAKGCEIEKETNLKITVLVDENVGRLEISVDDSSRVNVLESTLRFEEAKRLSVSGFACNRDDGGDPNEQRVKERESGTNKHLVEEVLDELIVQRPGGEESVKIGSEQLSHEVAERRRKKEGIGQPAERIGGRRWSAKEMGTERRGRRGRRRTYPREER